MRDRDKAIINHLEMFRVLDRNQIEQLHFKHLKDSTGACNRVLKRLTRDNKIDVDRSVRPYNYFPLEGIKKQSTKIPHFKAIADFYIEVCEYGKPTIFEVEFKTGIKGNVEPDVFMVWKGVPFFVEMQRNFYTKTVMNKKIKRYADYYYSREWKKHLKYYPYIWIVTKRKYHITNDDIQIIQTASVKEFVEKFKKK